MISPHPSLYLHIPLCSRFCSYCAFYSEEREKWKPFKDAYVRRLVAEIEGLRKRVGDFDTIFIGGGNPLSLSPDDLLMILEAAGKSRETTLEMNSESLDSSYDPLFSSLVTRISMGVQSLNQNFLTAIGRNSTRDENIRGIKEAMRLKEKFGLRVNFDLMTCLPDQEVEDGKRDIDTLLSLSSPDHISLYALTMEKRTPLARKVREGALRLPSPTKQAALLFALWDHLASRGFTHYEVSAFARDGAWCSHNLRYWNLLPYAGLGSHASSRLLIDGSFCEVQNGQSLFSYARGKPGDGYRRKALTKEEELEEFLLVTLRTRGGIEKNVFLRRFGLSFDDCFAPALRSLPPSRYKNSADRFFLTEEGLMSLNSIVLSLSLCC